MEPLAAPSRAVAKLLEGLRAGMPLEDAAAAAGLRTEVAEKVAGSPLCQALRAQGR